MFGLQHPTHKNVFFCGYDLVHPTYPVQAFVQNIAVETWLGLQLINTLLVIYMSDSKIFL